MSLSSILGTAIIGGKAFSIMSTISTELIIRTITKSTVAIGNLLNYITINNQENQTNQTNQNYITKISNAIQNMDMVFTINIIEQVVKEQENKTLPESIKKALIGVNDILETINKNLNCIKKSIEHHNTKYFSSWRSFECECDIDTIKNNNEILKQRYFILMELIKILNK